MLFVFDASIVAHMHSDRDRGIEKYQAKYMLNKGLEGTEKTIQGSSFGVFKSRQIDGSEKHITLRIHLDF